MWQLLPSTALLLLGESGSLGLREKHPMPWVQQSPLFRPGVGPLPTCRALDRAPRTNHWGARDENAGSDLGITRKQRGTGRSLLLHPAGAQFPYLQTEDYGPDRWSLSSVSSVLTSQGSPLRLLISTLLGGLGFRWCLWLDSGEFSLYPCFGSLNRD